MLYWNQHTRQLCSCELLPLMLWLVVAAYGISRRGSSGSSSNRGGRSVTHCLLWWSLSNGYCPGTLRKLPIRSTDHRRAIDTRLLDCWLHTHIYILYVLENTQELYMSLAVTHPKERRLPNIGVQQLNSEWCQYIIISGDRSGNTAAMCFVAASLLSGIFCGDHRPDLQALHPKHHSAYHYISLVQIGDFTRKII